MTDHSESTDQIIVQGRALAQALQALDAIEPDNYFEKHITKLLAAAYERRLKEILEAAPAWVSEEISDTR
ncbi:MAG: hypothetical protein GY832_15205 [Chloroflexi bacterium]|nr:hypothetical protein [Chloroflexota bacterium]